MSLANRAIRAIALGAVGTTAILWVSIGQRAWAQTPRTAVCMSKFGGGTVAAQTKEIEAWINERLAEGRTELLTTEAHGASTICAW